MEGKRFIHSIRLRRFLSYGELQEAIKLEPLNVIIGRNASGKSNLIEAVRLLHTLPANLAAGIRNAGGIDELIWKGKKKFLSTRIEVFIQYSNSSATLQHQITFRPDGQKATVSSESIFLNHSVAYLFKTGTAHFTSRNAQAINSRTKDSSINRDGSVLEQRKDPVQYPEITYLGKVYNQIKIYEALETGKTTILRQPQKTDLPEDFLLEDASNLGLVINDLQYRGLEKKLIEELQKFYPSVQSLSLKIQGGTVQIFVREEGLTQPVPATRLSDGTLRYLCLLTILCHPEPPPLICLEEPELGLHPDVLPNLAKLLIDASQRTQLIVTTHSDALVSALSEVPEAVLVCERDEDGTHLQRLDPEQLKEWLEKYSLGELWAMGEIGGN